MRKIPVNSPNQRRNRLRFRQPDPPRNLERKRLTRNTHSLSGPSLSIVIPCPPPDILTCLFTASCTIRLSPCPSLPHSQTIITSPCLRQGFKKRRNLRVNQPSLSTRLHQQFRKRNRRVYQPSLSTCLHQQFRKRNRRVYQPSLPTCLHQQFRKRKPNPQNCTTMNP